MKITIFVIVSCIPIHQANKVNISRPQEYEIVGGNPTDPDDKLGGRYYRNPFSECTIDISSSRKKGLQFDQETLVGVLPVGFRPQDTVRFAVTFTSQSGGNSGSAAGIGRISSDGYIKVILPPAILSGITSLDIVDGAVSFVAMP